MIDRKRKAFTLLELLVVIAIIVVLAGLLFPAVQSVLERAKKVQAKNDLTQIVTAVNAFYTEYGRYPISQTGDVVLNHNVSVLDVLRNDPTRSSSTVATLNPRGIAFITPPAAKDSSHPLSGIAGQDATVGNSTVSAGDLVDPWGTPYVIAIDGDYSGYTQVGTMLNYSDLTYMKDPPSGGPDAVQGGVIGASYGKDQTKGTKTPGSDNLRGSDDVISWQ